VVGYGSGGLAVIDPAGGAVLQRIPLPTHPESFQLDSNKGRAFVNLPDAHQIAVVNLNARQKIAGRQVPDRLGANFQMALDAARGIAVVVFRKPPRLVVFDTRAGKPTGTFTKPAERNFLMSLEWARRQQAKSRELPTAIGLARLWQSQGKRPGAYELFAPVYGWFSECFDTRDLRNAKLLLVELGERRPLHSIASC
jgi:hypothetical protein